MTRVSIATMILTLAIDTAIASDETVAELLEKFADAATFWEQGDVARKLVASGDAKIIPAIEKHLDTTDRRSRCNVGLVLAGLGDQRGLAVIIRELKDKNPRKPVS